MSNACRFLTLALLAVLLSASPSWAVTYGDVEIKPFAEPRGHSTHGYTEYRFVVRHVGKDEPRRVLMALPGNDDIMRGGRIQAVTREVIVDPGQTAYLSLLVPAVPSAYGSGAAVWIDYRKQEDRVPMSIATGMYAGPRRGVVTGGGNLLLLYSQRVPEGFFDPVTRGVAPIFGGGIVLGGVGGGGAPPPVAPPMAGAGKLAPIPGGGAEELDPGIAIPLPDDDDGAPMPLSGEQVRADTPVSLWSRFWLAYSRYDGILVTTEDLSELARGGNETLPILTALHQYVESGGVLFILGPGKVDLPASWLRQTTRETTGWAFDGGSTLHVAGFGRCVLFPDRDSAKWKRGRWSLFSNEGSGTGRPYNDNRSMTDLNQSLPPVEDLGVPVKGLFVLMFLFAIVIGPVNLALLSRWNRRIWLLWTVPAASAVTCAAVFGYMVIAEGWQGHARVTGFTILDESQKRATTVGRTSFYSPLTPGDGLRFDAETEVTAVGTTSMDYRRGGMEQTSLGSCQVDWKDGQHFRRGWVSARVPAHFMLRKSKTQHERVLVNRDGANVVMVNALSVAIKTIVLADSKGQLYEASDVAEGAKVVMRPAGKLGKTQPLALRTQAYGSSDWASVTRLAPAKASDYLTPGSYLAVIEGSPFLEQALKGAKVRDTNSVVLGLMADAP